MTKEESIKEFTYEKYVWSYSDRYCDVEVDGPTVDKISELITLVERAEAELKKPVKK